MNPMTDLWTVFGRDQGQIVERAYRYDTTHDRILRMMYDRSDESTVYDVSPCPPDVTWSGSEMEPPWSPADMDWTPISWDAVTDALRF